MATTQVFMSRESGGQRSLKGYSPWGHKELGMSDTTEYRHRDVLEHNIQGMQNLLFAV